MSGNPRVQVKVVLVIFFVSTFGRAQKVWQNEVVFIEQAALVLEQQVRKWTEDIKYWILLPIIYAALVNHQPLRFILGRLPIKIYFAVA